MNSPEVRRLRRKLGAEGVLAFLKMASASLRDDGYIEKTSTLGESFAEQIAFDIDEDEKVVRDTIRYCIPLGLIKPVVADRLMQFPIVTGRIKTLTPSAQRMRKLRAERKASQSDEITLQCADNTESEQKQESEHIKSDNKNFLYDSDDCLKLFDEKDCKLYGAEDEIPGDGRAAEAAPVRESSLPELMEVSEQGNVGLTEAGIEAYSAATQGGSVYLGSPVDVPLRAMRAWAKRNKKNHPEYFHGDGVSGKAAAGDPEPDKLPAWDSDSSDHVEYTDEDKERIEDFANSIPSAKFRERAAIGEREARRKLKDSKIKHDDNYFTEAGEEAAVRYFALNREKREPGFFSTGEISALMELFGGFDDDEFYGYFLKHRANE